MRPVRSMCIGLLLSACLAAGAAPGYAQAPPHWRFFTSADGLRESWIEDVTEAPSGRVWILHGSVDAATVYDGYAFARVPTPGHPLKAREGPTGQVWALAPVPLPRAYEGLQLYEQGRWTKFPVPSLASSGITRSQFLPWAHDRVLLLTPAALLEFDRATRTARTLRRATDTPLGRFTDLGPAAGGGAWVGGPGGLMLVTLADGSTREPSFATTPLPATWRAARMSRIHAGRGREVFVAVELSSAWASLRWDGARWTEVARSRSLDEVLESWAGRDPEVWTAHISPRHYHLELRLGDGPARRVEEGRALSGRLNAVEPLANGGFWLATSIGLVRHAPAAWRTPPELLELRGPVGGLLLAPDGVLYALHEAGVLRRTDGRWRSFPLPAGFQADVGLTSNIGALADGRIVVGVNEPDAAGPLVRDALLAFDPAHETFAVVRHPEGREMRLLGASGGALWIVTHEGTRGRLERYEGGRFSTIVDAGSRWAGGPPRQIVELGGGDLLLVPDSGGIGWLRGGRYVVTTAVDGYPGTGPFSALRVDPARFWFGDRDAVIAYDGRRWEVLRSGMQTVRAMASVKDGTRWVSSGAGLHRYRDGSWITMSTPDGFPDGAASGLAEDRDGRLWVGTTIGLTEYVPDADREPPRTSLDLPGNPTEAPPNGDAQFAFAGRDRWNDTTPERLLYSWRLDGGSWSELQPRAGVALHGLDAGPHRLDVRTGDRNGNVDPSPASLHFAVLLPWYRESGFLAVGALGLLALAAAIGMFVSRHKALERLVRDRTQALAHANEQLRADLAERQRFEQERARLEGQLHQAQKLEAVGRLAGGISHDFNNLLTVIGGYAETLRGELPPGSTLGPAVDEIARAAERAAALTRQLMAFSRHRLVAPQVLDLNVVVADIERMLRRLIGEDIALDVSPEAGLWPVLADRGQIEQVIVNLAVNARDAMHGGGRLRIGTSNVDLDDEFVRTHAGTVRGPYVRLSVADEGTGMDDETRARIFEPFFTTKARDKGSGLGLATVYGIVAQAGGHVWVQSEPGHGTTFTIYLPKTEAAARELGASRAGPAPNGRETILIVEDDDGVRDVTTHLLRGFGYVVEAVSSAEAALERLDAGGPAPDLVLTDIVLVGMSGPRFAARVRAARPWLRVLFMSGYADDQALATATPAAAVPFIQKPFTADALARKVRAALDAPLDS